MSTPGAVGGEAVPPVRTSLPPPTGALVDLLFLGGVGMFSCCFDKVTFLSGLNHTRPLYTLGVHPQPSDGCSSEEN